jgi:TPR repeat protein
MMETIAAKMKSEEIAEAKRRADQWSKTHNVSRDAGGGVFITEKKASQEDLDALRKLKGDAERGDPAAQSVLGEAYYRSRDYQNASVWFRKSAEQGYAPGQYNLGVMHLEGSGTAKDAGEALKWFLKAAEQRHLGAMNNLAALYFYGTGVPKDILQTYMWTKIAAQFGDENSTKNLAGLKQQLTGDQVAEGERRASQWLAEHPKR